ncbi:aldehyde dehydrogenase family protein [Nocardia sienata]|uniref:aldehyde dehydrogenase family protein n=1 Tax=Nocardia sienata TaxID=248552 RepID=UPI0007A4AB79|nr:aldehyde dehydrogenase family protein [Nocardia sienata]
MSTQEPKPLMLIGGELVAGDRELAVINPATGEPFTTVACASAEQVSAAVQAAEQAFTTWSRTTIEHRREVLIRIAETVEANATELARLTTSEQGKPFPIAIGEAMFLAQFIRYFAALPLEPEVVEDSAERHAIAYRRPLGVVAAIIPWNMPVSMLGTKLPAALLAGNTVVVKPAGTTPTATLRFGELIADLVPPGVVNVVADDNDLGDVLTGHPGVRKVSFTGSTPTGKHILGNSAASLKRVTLELGGNDAGIVLDDADPKAVAPGIFMGSFFNSGQICVALKRLYVHESIHDELVAELIALAENMVVGDGFAEGTMLGPVQNARQFDRVRELLEDSRRAGRIVTGGETSGPGYFLRPTIVCDVTDGDRIVDEEQFGPILPVVKYSDVDDAIRRSNASPFGLGGSVWSSDPERAAEVASRLECGTVWINKHGELAANVPFGGAKASGIGTELGARALDEMTQLQVVSAVPKPAAAPVG